jgi:DNA polymerase-3 subunit epsilon
MEKLRKKGISLSDLAKKCGFKPRSRHQRNISPEDLTDEELQFFRDNSIKVDELTSRWSWMDKNPQLVVTFFEEVILTFFGYVPTWDELANTEFYYYIQKLSKLDLSYPEVIKKANHVPNFQFLTDSQKKWIYKTTEFLVNEYLEIGNSSKIPSLLSLAKSNDLNVSDMTYGKYAKKYLIKIYGDEYGNQLYSEMWFNKTLGISNDIIKKINNLVDEYCSKFIQSNKIERPIPIKDIVEYIIPEISSHTFTKYAKELLVKNYGKQNGTTIYSEMWPSDNLATKVGSRLHVLINDLLTKFFNKRGIQYISEPYIYPGRRPDGVLILTEELKLLLKKNKSLLDQIKVRYEELDNLKAIVLDFTSDISDLNCTRKTIKYQHSEILLLIIGTSWYSKKPYKLIHGLNQNLSNVCVIDIGFFTKIIDLSSNLKAELQISLDFAQNYNLDSLNRIKALDKSNLHNTESLRKFLIKKGLIKEKIQEYLDLGLIDHLIKNKLTLEEKLTIKNEKLKNKIVIIDIETTGFNRDLDNIIEIGIVELDIKSGQIRTLFNSQVKDTNFDVSQHIDNTFIKTSGIDIYEISESISIKECEEDLQLIFDNYRCAAYNRTFDFGWLESRAFSIPMKLMDIMRFCIKSFPNCGSFKFQDVYKFITNQPNDFITKYLTRTYYKSNHRAIDDAICEAEVLFYLIKELGFSLTYQSKL